MYVCMYACMYVCMYYTYVCVYVYILTKFKAPRRMTGAGCVRATGSARLRSVM